MLDPLSGKVSFETRDLARQNTLRGTFAGKVRCMK